MRWEQRKPLWPKVAALGLLFVLTLTASRSWQSTKNRPALAQDQTASKPQAIEPSAIFEQTPPQTGLPLVSPIIGNEVVANETFSEPEPLPVRREFNLDTLLYVRDMLLTVVNQLPTKQELTEQIPTADQQTLQLESSKPRTPLVRVRGENDRLAMLPRFKRGRSTPVKKPSSPAEVTEKQANDFAAILLEAAKRPRSKSSTRVGSNPIQSARSQQLLGLRIAALPELPKAKQATTPEEDSTKVAQPTTTQNTQPEKPKAAKPQIAKRVPAKPSLHHRPEALIEQLEDFSAGSPGVLWAQQVLAQLRLLTEPSPAEPPNAEETLTRLLQLYESGIQQSQNPAQPVAHNQWLQATQALGRRLVVWQILLDPEQPKIILQTEVSIASLNQTLQQITTILEEAQNGYNWREYLLLDRIATLTADTGEKPKVLAMKRTKLTQEVLSRMVDPRLTPAQQEFLATPLLVELDQKLRPWATSKVNLETMAALIERYESGRELRFAGALAQLKQRLQWSEDPRLQALAVHLDTHYRAANMRIAINDELLNRMVPEQKPIVSPVNESIAGSKVRGSSRTTTQVQVRLLPDPNAWRIGLEAVGKVYSNTRSETWPARVRNAAKMHYRGLKEIAIDADGLHISPTKAVAQGRNELVGVDSQLDPIPLLGDLLRGIARKKHTKARPKALSQVKAKVVRQVKQRMNQATDPKLEKFEQAFRDKVLAPIEQLALVAEPLDMHTTPERAVMQLRLANSDQLAAHTLRPYAPSDSVMSVQMHETALNNAFMGLGLSGRRMTLIELFNEFALRFGKSDATPPEEMPQKAVIEFAARDTVRVQCEGDRIELILSVAELAYRRDKIKNFQIHVHFRPSLSGLDVRLVRDGSLQFSGRRLKTGPRVVLHSILGKILAKDQEINLVNTKMLTDSRLAGLMVTQLVIEDGWIGLALGPAHPRRTAWRTPKPEVLATPFVR